MMQEFDPRRPAFRLAPRVFVVMAGFAALVFGWRLTAAEAHLPGAGLLPLDPAAVAELQHQAFAEAEAQPGLAPAQNINIKINSGETFEGAVRRIGVAPEEAREVVRLLAQAFDTVHINAGLNFTAAVARPRDERGPVRLVGLSLRSGDASTITLSRTFDGALRLREMTEKISDRTVVIDDEVDGSLYVTARAAGASPTMIAEMTRLFSHKLDFSRDIHDGDKFRMVFDAKVTESGRVVEGGSLQFAELQAGKTGGPVRFYRFQPAGSATAQYFDENGRNTKGFLLRTPVDGARITSNFGMRRHPILGYDRKHQGIDFGAPSGTPVYAAGDGVVAEVRVNGGYGRWVKIRHQGGWETGYAHLSRWASGLRPGMSVSQGQLIAYVGTTGRSTGPHLHYEVMRSGVKINPKGANVPSGTILAGAQLAAFQVEKARIDGVMANAGGSEGGNLALRSQPAALASR